MTLNDWSIVYFAITAIYYVTIYFAMFRNPNVFKFLLLVVVWLLHLATTLVYGIVTGQVGFVLLFGLELAMIVFIYVLVNKLVEDADI
jgi:hypothetical protein